jgi:hypothetical protein
MHYASLHSLTGFRPREKAASQHFPIPSFYRLRLQWHFNYLIIIILIETGKKRS